MWLALTIPEREAIIRTLDDPPQTLAELRPCYFESTSGGFARGSSRDRVVASNLSIGGVRCTQ
jgi:hypothetical protein